MAEREQRRQPGEHGHLPMEAVVTNAILMAADSITRGLRGALFSSRGSDPIRVRSCPGQAMLYALERGDGWALDWEYIGKTAAQVRQQAIDEAEEDARSNVRAELERKAALVRCTGGCHPVPAGPTITLKQAGRITNIKPDTAGLVTRYDAAAMAEGTIVVNCVP